MPVRLLLVSGTRADLGLWAPVIEASRNRPEVDVSLLVTGMHLDQRFGATVSEARALGVPIVAELPFIAQDDSRAAMAASLGEALSVSAPALAEARPDWLGLLGDRGEQLAAALAALHLGIPVAHVHGGERTLGAVDDALRDMVSRVAHLHLVATPAAGARLERMGEEPWRIRLVGAPGLDGLAAASPPTADLRARHGLPADGPYLMVIHHPETVGARDPVADLRAVLEGVGTSGMAALAIGPNADAGGRALLHDLAQAPIAMEVSVPRSDYIGLLAGAAAIVGNSSSGIIEAPMLGVPAVNVGDRQRGRTRGDNVLDVPADGERIADAIRRAVDPSFRAALSRTSPYGDGHTAPRILDAILSTPVDEHLLMKEVAA
jgi:UDP-hydrolysing UDP-N-acetyl-D-glucosamine 2-epimerase